MLRKIGAVIAVAAALELGMPVLGAGAVSAGTVTAGCSGATGGTAALVSAICSSSAPIQTTRVPKTTFHPGPAPWLSMT